MSRINRPTQKATIIDPFSNESGEAPTTDYDENKRREKMQKKKELQEDSE